MPIPYKTPPPPSPLAKKRKASTKPRKRRTQTLAEKGNEPGVTYRWVELFDSFVFNPDSKVNIVITKENGKWHSTAEIMGKRYVGDRDNLETLFKAVANILYRNAKEYWLKMDSRVVTAKFPDFLKGEV